MADDNSCACAICLEEYAPTKQMMITSCNHMFHKKCLMKHITTRNNKCPICRSPQPNSEYTTYKYTMADMPDCIADIFNSERILFCKSIFDTNIYISGSCAVWCYMTLQNGGKPPNWRYNDIDVVVHDTNKNKHKFTKDDVQNTMKINDSSVMIYKIIKSYDDNYNLINIESIHKTVIVPFNICECTDVVIHKMDIIKYNNKKCYKIVEGFDLDCCKVAVKIYAASKTIKFYIYNKFYCDEYITTNSKTLARVEKYRARGFMCSEKI